MAYTGKTHYQLGVDGVSPRTQETRRHRDPLDCQSQQQQEQYQQQYEQPYQGQYPQPYQDGNSYPESHHTQKCSRKDGGLGGFNFCGNSIVGPNNLAQFQGNQVGPNAGCPPSSNVRRASRSKSRPEPSENRQCRQEPTKAGREIRELRSTPRSKSRSEPRSATQYEARSTARSEPRFAARSDSHRKKGGTPSCDECYVAPAKPRAESCSKPSFPAPTARPTRSSKSPTPRYDESPRSEPRSEPRYEPRTEPFSRSCSDLSYDAQPPPQPQPKTPACSKSCCRHCFVPPEPKTKQPPPSPPKNCCKSCFEVPVKRAKPPPKPFCVQCSQSQFNSREELQQTFAYEAQARPRSEPRQEPRRESRSESRQEPSSEPRRESRQESRRVSRSESLQEPSSEPRREPRSELRQEPRRESRQESRQESRTVSRSESRQEPSSEPRREPRSEAPCYESTFEKPRKAPRPRCEGCYEPRPQPDPYPDQSRRNSCPPSNYTEYKDFRDMSHRNPLVVKSYGCLSQCSTQGGSPKRAKVSKSKPTYDKECSSHGVQPTQSPTFCARSCPAGQSSGPSRSQPRQQQEYYGSAARETPSDYAELQNRSGRFIDSPLTTSRCRCNMAQPAPKKPKSRSPTPYCSNESVNEQPVQSHQYTSAPRKEAGRKCTRCSKPREKSRLSPSYAVQQLTNNPRTYFVPQMWFNEPHHTVKKSPRLKKGRSCTALTIKSSAPMSRARRKTRSSQSQNLHLHPSYHRNCYAPPSSQQLSRRRSCLPKRRLSGCGLACGSRKCTTVNLRTRRIRSSKLSTDSGSSILPMATLLKFLKSRRTPKANPCAMRLPTNANRSNESSGHRRLRKQSSYRCRGGKLTPLANSSNGARNVRRRARDNPQSGIRSVSATSPHSSRMQTAVRRDRVQSQTQSRPMQETQNAPELLRQPAVRSTQGTTSRRDLPQRPQPQTPYRPVPATDNMTITGTRQPPSRTSNAPARNMRSPAVEQARPEVSRAPAERRDNQRVSIAEQERPEVSRAQAQIRERNQSPNPNLPATTSRAAASTVRSASERAVPQRAPQAHKKSSEKQITTQRPQYFREPPRQAQEQLDTAVHTHGADACLGTNIHHFYRGSFLAVRSTHLDERPQSSNQVETRPRTQSLLTFAQNMLRPKVLKRSVPKGSSFVVPNKWQGMHKFNGFVPGNAIVDLRQAHSKQRSGDPQIKSGWTWRRLCPNWLINGKARTTSA